MDWTMKETAVKVQLFASSTYCPCSSSPPTLLATCEYFREAEESLPVDRRSPPPMPQRGLAGRLLAGTAAWNAQRQRGALIAGSNLAETLKVVADQRNARWHSRSTLGEATINEAEAIQSQKEYIQLCRRVEQGSQHLAQRALIDEGLRRCRGQRVVKLSSLYSQFDPIDPEGTSRIVRSRLRPVLQAAQASGVFVNLDMEQYSFKDLTIRIFCEILDEPEFRNWPNVGIAIQAYLKDCLEDLRKLRDWAARRGTSVWVRLVKGAYWDYESVISSQLGWPCPVFEEKPQTDANYEACTQFLIENHELLHPAFGSHNIRSLAFALATAHAAGLPKGAYEVQMLYGMADPIKRRSSRWVNASAFIRLMASSYREWPIWSADFWKTPPRIVSPQLCRQGLRGASAHEPASRQKPCVAISPPPARAFLNEPFADFSRDEVRQQWISASAVKSQLGRTFRRADRTREVRPG